MVGAICCAIAPYDQRLTISKHTRTDMPNYRRNFVPGGTYFFTVTLLDRNMDMLVTHIESLRAAVRSVRSRYPFEIVAWVVRPDHLHCIWTLPAGDSDYPGRWRGIKQRFSSSLPHAEQRSPVRERRGERGVWQRRYWEHTIRDDRDLRAHVDYIHINPQKHGYVSRVADWPHSTFHRYVRDGIYPADWAGDANMDIEAGEPT